jgi:small-conductance mechanosensitive channel
VWNTSSNGTAASGSSQYEFGSAIMNEGESGAHKASAKKIRSFGFGIVNYVLRMFLGTVIIDPDVLRVTSKIISYVIWIFIILSALGTFGVDIKPMVSLVSVVGVTIGLAAKDILTNTFVGILIILTSPFKRGWIISIEGQRGKVIGLDTRYVRLQSLRDKSEILIPLSLVYKSSIIIEKRDEE